MTACPCSARRSASAEGQGEFVLYTTDDGLTRVEMRAEGGSLWLSQAEIATLFQTTPQNVTQHVKAIYSEGEADSEATCKSGLQVRKEGGRLVRRNVRFYSLDVILAVGYRARSARGTQFRQWATANLSEYLLKGFVMDDERLKNPPVGDSVLPDRFGELLERIRDIRASERRMYLRVREIFALAADYLLLAWMVVGIVYAAWGYYHEPIAREGAKAFCESVRVGQSPTGLLEQALDKGADDYQTRWMEMVGGKRHPLQDAAANLVCALHQVSADATEVHKRLVN